MLPILFTFFHHLLYLRVHVFAIELHSPRDSFRSIFSYFYRSAYTTSINHHNCTLSLIFSPRTIISGRLSPLSLAVFRFYLFSSFSFSHWHFIFILLPYFCRSFILIFSTCTVLITVLINVFLFKFLSFEKIWLTFVFIYLMIRILRRTATLDFAHISRRVPFTFFMSLTSRLLPLNQFHRLRSHILLSRFFSSDKCPDLK